MFTLIAEGLISSVDAFKELMRVLPMSAEGEPDWKNIVFIDAFKAFKKHCPESRHLPVWDQISIDHYLGTVNIDDRIFLSQRMGPIIEQRKLDTFVVDPSEIDMLMQKHPNAEKIAFGEQIVGLIVPLSGDFKLATKAANGESSLWELRYTSK